MIRLVGALFVEINDGMNAAERLYIAAASVADIDGIDTDLRILPSRIPRLTTSKRIARPSYATPQDAI